MSETPPELMIKMFGHFTVHLGNDDPVRFSRSHARWMLALLLMHREQEIEYSYLSKMLWPGATTDNSNVRQSLTILRHCLTPQRFINPSKQSIRLDLTGMTVDMYRFDDAIARHADPDTLDTKDASIAVASYSGPFLQDCPFPWARQEQELRHAQYISALARLADEKQHSGDFIATKHFLRSLIASEPTNEEWLSRLVRLTLTCDGAVAASAIIEHHLEELKRNACLPIRLTGLTPGGELEHLYAQLRQEQTRFSDTTSQVAVPTIRLPELPHICAPLIGRAATIQAIMQHLTALQQQHRLILLKGPSGFGKTQLALSLAGQIAPNYMEGVGFVELNAADDLRGVQRAILSQLEIPREPQRDDIDSICEFLGSHNLLLILDNCDRAVNFSTMSSSFAEFIKLLLVRCPKIRILLTSTNLFHSITPLKTFHISGLTIPPHDLMEDLKQNHLWGVSNADQTTLKKLQAFDGVQLFLQEADNEQPHPSQTLDSMIAIGNICRFLDGSPLGIKLAARQTKLRSPEEIWNAISKDPRSLYDSGDDLPQRHCSLWNTICASVDMLSSVDQDSLAHLSVLQHSWSLEAAERVLGMNSTRASVLIQRLIDHSLVGHAPHMVPARFRMPNIVHRYAYERLRQSQLVQQVTERLLDYCIELAEGEQNFLGSAEPARTLQRLELDEPSFLVALEWAVKHHLEKGLRLVAALGNYWFASGNGEQGSLWFDRMLKSSPEAPLSLRTNAMRRAANLALFRHDYVRAHSLYVALLDLERKLGDTRRIAVALGNLGNSEMMVGHFDPAYTHLHDCLEMFTRLDDTRGIAQALGNLAVLARRTTKLDEACEWHHKSIDLFRQVDAPHDLLLALNNLARARIQQGDLPSTAATLREAFALIPRVNVKATTGQCLFLHGRLATQVEMWGTAAWLLGCALHLSEAIRLAQDEQDEQGEPEPQELMETIRANIGTQELQTKLQEGVRYSLEELQPHVYAIYDRIARQTFRSRIQDASSFHPDACQSASPSAERPE